MMLKAWRLLNDHAQCFQNQDTSNGLAAAMVFWIRMAKRHSPKKSFVSPSGRFAIIPEGSIWHHLNHARLTSCGTAPWSPDKEGLEVNVPEGDPVPEGAPSFGFYWYKQLIKYLWLDSANEDAEEK